MPLYELDNVRPQLPASGRYWIAPSAELIGKVIVHEEASIWFGSVLRGDNEWIEVAEGANVQENCTLHTDPTFPLRIGARCTIGHNVVLHGCSIGDNSLVGMGAIVLNGAKIGNNSLVGAGALVTEGKTFPNNSLIVGAPARVIRTLDKRAVELITEGADIYVRRGQHYRKALKRIG